MAQSDNIETIVQVGFDRVHHELQTGKNFLASLFTSGESYRQRKKFYDYMGKLEAGDISETAVFRINPSVAGTRAGSRGNATPAKQFNDWRRRELNTLAAQLHIEAARAEAQTVNLSVEQLLAKRGESMKAAMERKAIEHIIALITGGYRENPNLLTGTPQATLLPFQPSQRVLAPVTGTAGNATLTQLSPRDFFVMNSILDNAFGVDPEMMGGMRPELDKVKRVCICSNSWWASFQYHNFEQRGNKDFFGKDLLMKGYSVFLTNAGTLFVPIPDEFLPVGDSLSTRKIIGSSQTLLDAGRRIALRQGPAGVNAVTGAALTDRGLHRLIFLNPKVFELKKPINLQVPKIEYRDKDSSFEKGCYAEWSTSGIRHYDEAVFEIYAPDYTGQRAVQLT